MTGITISLGGSASSVTLPFGISCNLPFKDNFADVIIHHEIIMNPPEKKKQDNTCCNRHFHSRTPGSCLVFPSPVCRFPLLSRDPQDPQLSSGSRSIFLQVHHHLGQVFQHLLHLTSSNGWSATRDPFWTFIQRKEQEIKIDQRSKDVQRLQSFFIAI